MAGHECDKEKVIEMMKNATDKIFNKLDDMSVVLQNVAIQKREMEIMAEKLSKVELDAASHEMRIIAIELKCAARHNPANTSLAVQVRNAVVIGLSTTAALAIMSLVAYAAYVHLSGWIDFTRTQINGEPSKKTSQH